MRSKIEGGGSIEKEWEKSAAGEEAFKLICVQKFMRIQKKNHKNPRNLRIR